MIEMPGTGVLWDMDGVLVDTGEFHYHAWAETLAEYAIPYSREAHRATFGMNNTRILAALLGDTVASQLVSEIGEKKEERFRRAIKGQARALPGVVDWLERLRAAGVCQAIASSAPRANIDALIGELGLESYFQAVVPGQDLPGKPDPALFLEAARLVGVPPGRCVVVEDAVAGVEAAKRGGMKCIAVTTSHPADHLRAADLVVDRLDNLPPDAFWRLLKRPKGG